MKHVLWLGGKPSQGQLERDRAGLVCLSLLRGDDQVKGNSDLQFGLLNYVGVNIRNDGQPAVPLEAFQGGPSFIEHRPIWDRFSKSCSIALCILYAEFGESVSEAEGQDLSVAPVPAANKFEIQILPDSYQLSHVHPSFLLLEKLPEEL